MANLEHLSWRILPFCWLFMSIMFPFIFAMSLRNLREDEARASFQIMSIVGGAIAPPLMGGWRHLPQHGPLLRPPLVVRGHGRLRFVYRAC